MSAGRYPDSDILDQRGHWDPATRRVVLDRVHNIPAYRYFTVHEQATLEALCARIIPQDQRPIARRVPLAPWIDQRCHLGVLSGFRFDDMPPDEVAWRQGLAGLDQAANALHAADFADLLPGQQDAVLAVIRDGQPPGAVWAELPVGRWWVYVVLRQVTGVYYAHPYAWDEIGFGGPAYPRGYFALNNGAPEPWEAREAPRLGEQRESRVESEAR